MLFDPSLIVTHPVLVLLLLLAFIVGKAVLAAAIAVLMRFPARVAALAGIGLAQFGEFGFVLARQGLSEGVVTETEVGPLLTAGILSMFLTPVLVRVSPHFTAGEQLLRPLELLVGARSLDEPEPPEPSLRDHVIVVGYGVAGRIAAESLAERNVPYIVLELNAETVRDQRKAGEHVIYADATSREALGHAHVERARAVVVLINDPRAAERIVDAVKRVAPGVPILLRARYLTERDALVRTGATDVVVDEVEAAIAASRELVSWL
jgi:CPA2 family monovalent cation:H+ antiporter-2